MTAVDGVEQARIGVVGLGYVGLPLALALARSLEARPAALAAAEAEELGPTIFSAPSY